MRSRPSGGGVDGVGGWMVASVTNWSGSIYATPGMARTASSAWGGNLALNPITAEVYVNLIVPPSLLTVSCAASTCWRAVPDLEASRALSGLKTTMYCPGITLALRRLITGANWGCAEAANTACMAPSVTASNTKQAKKKVTIHLIFISLSSHRLSRNFSHWPAGSVSQAIVTEIGPGSCCVVHDLGESLRVNQSRFASSRAERLR